MKYTIFETVVGTFGPTCIWNVASWYFLNTDMAVFCEQQVLWETAASSNWFPLFFKHFGTSLEWPFPMGFGQY